MSTVIKGWKPASQYCNGVPVRTLRKAVADGTLQAHKEDGVWTFEVTDLRAFASHARATAPVAQPAVQQEPSLAPEVDSPAAVAPKLSQSPPLASWLLTAVGETADPGDKPEPERAERVVGPPLGASRGFGEWWVGHLPALHAPAQLVELAAARRDASTARAQAEQAAQTIAGWREAYRSARVQAIAGAIALEVLAAGHRDVHVVYDVANTVARALQQLSDDQLAEDAYAHGVARASAAWHLHAWQMHARAPADDLTRARLRRGRR